MQPKLLHKQSQIHMNMNSFQDIKVRKPIGCKQPRTQFTLATLWDLAWTYEFQDSFSAPKDRWQGIGQERIQERKVGDLGCAGVLAFECAQQVAHFLQRQCQKEKMLRNCGRSCKHRGDNAPVKKRQTAKSHSCLLRLPTSLWQCLGQATFTPQPCALVALPYPDAAPRICWQTL